MEELDKICPIARGPWGYPPVVKAVVLPWINNNAGLVVLCKRGYLMGDCPMDKKYIWHFPLNPEKLYPSGDPRKNLL